jgi:hypothetical protein
MVYICDWSCLTDDLIWPRILQEYMKKFAYFSNMDILKVFGHHHFEYILNVLNTCHADFLGDVYRLSGANRLLHVNVRHTGGTTVHGIPSLRYLQKRPPCVCQEASTQSQVNPSLLLDYSRMFSYFALYFRRRDWLRIYLLRFTCTFGDISHTSSFVRTV